MWKIFFFLVKIDIEGDEYKIIKDIKNFSNKIHILIVEFHNLDKPRKLFKENIIFLKTLLNIIHIHGNNQISGFYFLKCSEATSHPVFHDPRPGKVMTDLLAKDNKKVNYNTNQVHYKVKPGTFIFFNSYMPHSYIHHKGKETFRFIHFNMQAGIDPKSVQKT